MPQKEPLISLWTVYCRPKDYPYGYIARRHDVHMGFSMPTDKIVTSTTLEGVRRQLPVGLVRLDRNPNDDPVIVEIWI